MAFEHLGNTAVSVGSGVDSFELTTVPRAYTALVYLDGLDGDTVVLEIEVDFDPGGGGAFRSIWTSGAITVAAATTGYAAIPGIAIPPWPTVNVSRLVVTVTGTGGQLMWDLYGL